MVDQRSPDTAPWPVDVGLRFLWSCYGGHVVRRTTIYDSGNKTATGAPATPTSTTTGTDTASTCETAAPLATGNSSTGLPLSFDEVVAMANSLVLTFPPTLFCVGDLDPLLQSSVLTHQHMLDVKCRSDLKIYKGGIHGFFGTPPPLPCPCGCVVVHAMHT